MARRAAKPRALRLTLRQLQIFAAVARAGSTAGAARAISLSQSATSAALNELEALLGSRLFNRTGGRLVLNEHGRSLLPRALLALDAAQGIESEFGPAGEVRAPELRIAASTTTGNYVLPGVIAAYRRGNTGARFCVEIGNTRRVVRSVTSFDADLGFIEGPTTEPRLEVVPWMQDELVLVCSPRHPLARLRRTLSIEDLQRAGWLLREPGSGTREVVEAALHPRLQRLETVADLGSVESIRQAAAEGLGITCLSRFAVADQVKLGRLVILKAPLAPLKRTFCLVRPAGRLASPTLERFVAFCLAYSRRR